MASLDASLISSLSAFQESSHEQLILSCGQRMCAQDTHVVSKQHAQSASSIKSVVNTIRKPVKYVLLVRR